jgi:hypothetical protein
VRQICPKVVVQISFFYKENWLELVKQQHCTSVPTNIIKKISVIIWHIVWTNYAVVLATHVWLRLAWTSDFLGLLWWKSLFNGWIITVHKFYHVWRTLEHSFIYMIFFFLFSIFICTLMWDYLIIFKIHKNTSLCTTLSINFNVICFYSIINKCLS